MQSADTLREVDPDPAIVDEDVLHFEICALGVVLFVKLDEGILQRIACLLVSDHFTRKNLAEARKDKLEIVAARYGIELTDEQDVLWWSNVCERQIADHLERESGGVGVGVASPFFLFRLVLVLGEILIVSQTKRAYL